MSTAAPISRADVAARPVEAAARPGSVVSAGFDLAFFILPPLGTALFLAAQATWPVGAFALCALVWVGLAQSHFGATLLFYLDPRSLERYRRSPGVYFVAPAILIGGWLALGFTPLAAMALLAVPVFSFWHGNKQSIGVCGLYRGLTRSFAPAARRLETVAVFAGSACFTAVGLVRLGMLERLGITVEAAPAWLRLGWWAALAGATALLVAAEAAAFGQCRAASVRPWMRMSMLATSWAMYAPYLIARDALSAYLAALIPHYLQYHGLLYLVNRNKVEAGAVHGSGLLPALVRRPWTYAGATAGFGALLGALLLLAHVAGRVEVGLALVAGINLAHFWLDGFFWRFRDPQAREATLRFIHPLAVPGRRA